MKTLQNIKNIINKNKKLLGQQFQVKEIGIFGSYARGESARGSDIDILVEFSESPDFFKFIRLEKLLGHLLGNRVDLVTRKALKSLIKKDILKETIFL